MANEHQCGPDHDREFFAALGETWDQFPEMRGKYHIVCVDHETDRMNIDFDQQVRLLEIRGPRVISEFVDLAEFEPAARSVCCDWCKVDAGYKCCGWWKD
jgi:hypothetical protein